MLNRCAAAFFLLCLALLSPQVMAATEPQSQAPFAAETIYGRYYVIAHLRLDEAIPDAEDLSVELGPNYDGSNASDLAVRLYAGKHRLAAGFGSPVTRGAAMYKLDLSHASCWWRVEMEALAHIRHQGLLAVGNTDAQADQPPLLLILSEDPTVPPARLRDLIAGLQDRFGDFVLQDELVCSAQSQGDLGACEEALQPVTDQLI